jgi:L-threonylcarbamoyladenylate synthase
MTIISNCTASVIKDAALALKEGHLVAFPTETVYGLGADATNEKAVARIYEVKGRPTDHPLIVHISSLELLDKWAREIPEYAIKLARAFWPGPMTLVLNKTHLAQDFITGNQDTVAIRVPSHVVSNKLIKEFENLGGLGVAAPSANRFGRVSPTNADAVSQEILKFLSPDDLIIDGGNCSVGIESTIINCTQDLPAILRPGAVTPNLINDLLEINIGIQNTDNKLSQIRTSGMLSTHYAPKAKVILSSEPEEGDGYIALLEHLTPPGVIRLASPRNEIEFAQVLYNSLRLADEKNLSKVFVNSPLGDGIAAAIRDRLTKASTN